MALDRQRQVGAGHALAVIGHANEATAAAVGEHVDARGAGIERVLDELLDHACRALDHLAGGDAVDDGFGKLADGHGQLAQAAPTLAVAALRREGSDQSNDGLARRSCFNPARCFLPSMRRSREARVGLVGRRGRGGIAARRMRSMRRSSASCRLRAWVRWRCAMMTRTPSRVSRAPASRSSRARTSSRSDGDPRTSKRSCTAVASLLTFWPPGPEARTKLSSISRSSTLIWAVTRIISIRNVARIER